MVERGERVRAELGPLVRDRLGQRRELRVRLRRQLAWQLAEAPRVHRVGERRQVAQRGVEDAVDEDHLPPGRVRREPRLERGAGREPRRPHRPRREDRRHVGPPPRLVLARRQLHLGEDARRALAQRSETARRRLVPRRQRLRHEALLLLLSLHWRRRRLSNERARWPCPRGQRNYPRRSWVDAYAMLLTRRDRQNQQGDAAAPRRRCHESAGGRRSSPEVVGRNSTPLSGLMNASPQLRRCGVGTAGCTTGLAGRHSRRSRDAPSPHQGDRGGLQRRREPQPRRSALFADRWCKERATSAALVERAAARRWRCRPWQQRRQPLLLLALLAQLGGERPAAEAVPRWRRRRASYRESPPPSSCSVGRKRRQRTSGIAPAESRGPSCFIPLRARQERTSRCARLEPPTSKFFIGAAGAASH